MQADYSVPPEVVERARRMGPVPHSALGIGPVPQLPPAAEVAAWFASTADDIWHLAGEPDPFTVVEVGAGDGARAREFLEIGPECLAALRLILVEEDPALRGRHSALLSVESPAFVLGPVGRPTDEDDADEPDDTDQVSRPALGIGPMVTSLAELPVVVGVGLVIAVGWMSRLPYDLYEWRDGRWWELRLTAPDAGDDTTLVEIPVPLDRHQSARVEAAAGDPAGDPAGRGDGYRHAGLTGASAWLAGALRSAESGWLVAADRWTHGLDELYEIRRPAAPEGPAPGDLTAVRWRLG